VSLFRRREPLHVQLAREGGLSLDAKEPIRPSWDAAGIHGNARPRQWDAVVTVDAPGLEGDRAAFVALADGDLVVDEGPDDLEPLATALEQELAPPYRAEAVRRDGTVWAVAGRKIEVAELPDVAGEELELTAKDDEHTLLIDGERSFGSIPALELPGQVVRARRVDGELWEVETTPL
jgi:hypothetical protein